MVSELDAWLARFRAASKIDNDANKLPAQSRKRRALKIEADKQFEAILQEMKARGVCNG